MKVTFWGTRGSIATPGAGTVRYGGNTPCVGVVTDSGELLILDAGTGARGVGDHLLATAPGLIRGSIFLTHTHWDHIQGFPFFAPVFVEGNQWRVYGPSDGARQLEEVLSGQMQYTYFPVEMAQVPAGLTCVDLDEGIVQLGDVKVRTQYLNHPAVTLGYRVEADGASVAYCTDHEPFSPNLFRDPRDRSLGGLLHPGDRRHAEFFAGADLLIHDAQYTAEEYERKRNWGHSSIDHVVDLALIAGVRRVAIFHHDPSHDDAFLDSIESYARARAEGAGSAIEVFCAREGQSVELVNERLRGRAEERPPATQPAARARILVADDDDMILALVRDILEEERFTVEMAATGVAALDAARTTSPDLILLDMRLPVIDGFQVLTQLRGSEAGKDVPVIMLTGITDEEYVHRGFQLGATDYMTKPFSPPQLRARISAWLRRAAHDAAHTT